MEEKKKASEAHMRATAKWEKENYDKAVSYTHLTLPTIA